MKRYDRVKQILDEAVNDQNIGAHGAFWRGLSIEGFKNRTVSGKKLLILGDGPNSNLILALRGRAPFGADSGTPGAKYPRMPVGFPPVPDDRVAFIEQWITDGCPDDEWIEPTGRN